MAFTGLINGALETLYQTSNAGVEAYFDPATGEDIGPITVILELDTSYQGAEVAVSEPRNYITYRRSDIDRKVIAGEIFTIGGVEYAVRGMSSYPGAWNEYEGKAIVEEV